MKNYMIAFEDKDRQGEDKFIKQRREFYNFREAAHYAFRQRLELGNNWTIRYVVEDV